MDTSNMSGLEAYYCEINGEEFEVSGRTCKIRRCVHCYQGDWWEVILDGRSMIVETWEPLGKEITRMADKKLLEKQEERRKKEKTNTGESL